MTLAQECIMNRRVESSFSEHFEKVMRYTKPSTQKHKIATYQQQRWQVSRCFEPWQHLAHPFVAQLMPTMPRNGVTRESFQIIAAIHHWSPNSVCKMSVNELHTSMNIPHARPELVSCGVY
jgi:hypothetical protein